MSTERSRIYPGNIPELRYPRVPQAVEPVEIAGLGKIVPMGRPTGPVMSTEEMLKGVLQQLSMFSATQVLKRTMIPRKVDITTTPAAIIQARSLKGYLLINPASALISGIPQSGTLVASATRSANGNSQSTSLGVSNYRTAHIYLDISATVAAATMDFYIQTKDPVTGNWVDSQLIWANVDTATAVGTYYAYVGPQGIGSEIAVRWVLLGGTSVTFSVGYVLKESLPGSSSGVSQTVYLGGNNGVTVNAGFPLLEGQSWAMYLEDGANLWGVSETAVTVRVFELQ